MEAYNKIFFADRGVASKSNRFISFAVGPLRNSGPAAREIRRLLWEAKRGVPFL